MTLPLILTLMGIAFVDSLNPSLFFAQFYLLLTPRPVARILAYIGGVLTVNAFGGWLILNNARDVIAGFLSSINPTLLMLMQVLIGVALLAFGLWYRATPTDDETKTPRSLHPLATYGFGMLVMLNEITTALPYFVAIEEIAQARLPLIGNIAALALYNLIFALPLIGFLVLFLMFKERFSAGIERIRVWLKVWIPRILKAAAVLFGIFLIVDGLPKLLG